MKNRIFNTFAITIILLSVLIIGCTSKPETEIESSQLCLDEAVLETISTEKVINEPSYRNLKLPGQITVNKDRVYKVFPAASGVITDVYVRLGDRVKKGQVLATVQSPDIAEFNRDKRSALAEKSIAERNLKLAESLHESGVYSMRDLLEAQKTLENIEAEISHLNKRQAVLGIANGDSEYTIKAPESGFVVERNINPGLNLRNDDGHVFEISDLGKVWVVANISESDIRNIKLNADAKITTLAYPDKEIAGKIVRLSNTIDPQKRTMEAIIELPNPDYLLKPGMFANIEVRVENEALELSIHSNSLLFDNNKHYAVVLKSPCNIEARAVSISSRNADRVFIQAGVEEGEIIISDRQVLIYNQLTAKNKS